MPIEWRDKLSVGDPTLDADHKNLIKIINEFEEKADAGFDRQVLSETLKRLMGYAKEHFAREERLQARINYPYYDRHCQEHRRLLRDVEGHIRTYMEDTSTEIDGEVKLAMLHFLRDWLINHIIEQDLKMRPFLGVS